MAIDWTRGYAATWRAYRVDPRTWADGERIGGVTALRVERTDPSEGDAPLLESGSMDVDAQPGEGFASGYVRVAMVAEQAGERERVDVCTLLCETVSGDVERGADMLEVTGRSVLFPASVARLDPGAYAPAGVDAPQLAAELLSERLSAPVSWAGSGVLDAPYVYGDSATALSAAWMLARACGHVIRVGGDGSVSVVPARTQPALTLDRANARLLHPGVHHELDCSGVPNRYVAQDGAEVAVAVNDDPASMVSTVSRGYAHDAPRDASPVRVGGETLAAYAARRLEEESTLWDERGYSREFVPGVVPGDVVRGSLASVGLDGDLRVSTQSLACGRGIVVRETAKREVRLWSRT